MSLKRITANRLNAKRSTGPRTDAGRARSRLNSWKHGMTAQDMTVGDEDPREFEAFRAGLFEKHHPAGGLESVLLDSLARSAWRLGRVPGLEAICFEIMPGFENELEFKSKMDLLLKLDSL